MPTRGCDEANNKQSTAQPCTR